MWRIGERCLRESLPFTFLCAFRRIALNRALNFPAVSRLLLTLHIPTKVIEINSFNPGTDYPSRRFSFKFSHPNPRIYQKSRAETFKLFFPQPFCRRRELECFLAFFSLPKKKPIKCNCTGGKWRETSRNEIYFSLRKIHYRKRNRGRLICGRGNMGVAYPTCGKENFTWFNFPPKFIHHSGIWLGCVNN